MQALKQATRQIKELLENKCSYWCDVLELKLMTGEAEGDL